ncbi:hypothetical protein J6590_087949 [Homalodisca vitripennis]|nr:hypothetical protein J6590_087949 [Homalodisca vitripennis]
MDKDIRSPDKFYFTLETKEIWSQKFVDSTEYDKSIRNPMKLWISQGDRPFDVHTSEWDVMIPENCQEQNSV